MMKRDLVPPPMLFLSDGGHIENLGIFALIFRQCKFIISIDSGSDPKLKFYDLKNAMKLAEFFGLIEDKEYLPAGAWKELKDAKDKRIHILIKVTYPNDGEVKTGYILYVKLKKKPDYEPTCCDSFPYDSTADQIFTPERFKNYSDLGKNYIEEAFNDQEVRRIFTECFPNLSGNDQRSKEKSGQNGNSDDQDQSFYY